MIPFFVGDVIDIFLIVLLLLIAMMIWAFISFGSYLYSLVASVF